MEKEIWGRSARAKPVVRFSGVDGGGERSECGGGVDWECMTGARGRRGGGWRAGRKGVLGRRVVRVR